MSNFKVEKGIEVPSYYNQYPFHEMEIGDSFVIPAELTLRARGAANSYRQRTGKKFSVRKMRDGSVRVFRTE